VLWLFGIGPERNFNLGRQVTDAKREMTALGQIRSSDDVRRTTALTLEADLAGSRV